MGKIYQDQTRLKITVDLQADITGATVKLKYEKPDCTTGELTAVIEDATSGVVSYMPPIIGSPLDQNGLWTMWAFVTFADNRIAPGEPFEFKLNIEGN